jgi:phosphoribosylaminoimidazolecarboxamide formyltransferase/IMP cyclohydrolase
MKVTQALLSVSDKTGVVEFARELSALGVKLLSTGGTAKSLRDAGLPVTDVSDYTGFPEMLDGRVKTLHPKVHGGILARRDLPEHLAKLDEHASPHRPGGGQPLPFQATVAKPDCTLEDAIENIDIGGPTMVRAAAKNHGNEAGGVGIVTDPKTTRHRRRAEGQRRRAGYKTRFDLARKAFTHTARYDSAISNHLTALADDGSKMAYPERFQLAFDKVQDLRYGENPHQSAAFYRESRPRRRHRRLHPAAGQGAVVQQHRRLRRRLGMRQGLRRRGLRDRQARQPLRRGRRQPARSLQEGLLHRPHLAFGGIIAFNTTVDRAAAEAVSAQFLEVLIAPAYTDEALELLKAKQNVRVLIVRWAPSSSPTTSASAAACWCRAPTSPRSPRPT